MNGPDPVLIRKDFPVGIITLNTPEQGNVLNRENLILLKSGLRDLKDDPDIRVIILRSAEKVFSRGMDLVFLQKTGTDKTVAQEAVDLYSGFLRDMLECPKPVIAVVEGEVKAGGTGLVCAADIVLAAEEASVELSEVFFGLIPANVLPFLMGRRMPVQKVRALVMTGKKLSALQAQTYGIFDDVFSPESLEKGLRGVLKNLLRASPDALAETKRFTGVLQGLPLDKALKEAGSTLLDLISRPAVKNAIAGFNEGRTPEWFARYRPAGPLTGEDKE